MNDLLVLFIFGCWLTTLTIVFVYMLSMRKNRFLRAHRKDAPKSDVDIGQIVDRLHILEQQAKTAIHAVGIVRFNAFQDVGSDQSFAIALLDAEGNGAVVSTIHARTTSRTYAKPIVRYKSLRHELSKEEEKAVQLAIANTKRLLH